VLIGHKAKVIAEWIGEPERSKLLYFDMIMSFLEDSAKVEAAAQELRRRARERRIHG